MTRNNSGGITRYTINLYCPFIFMLNMGGDFSVGFSCFTIKNAFSRSSSMTRMRAIALKITKST